MSVFLHDGFGVERNPKARAGKHVNIIGGLYVTFIIIMSLVPFTIRPEIDPTEQTVASHFTAYFLMMLWYAWIYPARTYLRLAIIFILLGFGLECVQEFLETREFQVVDIFFNTMGVSFAWLVAKFSFARLVPE